ncbi:MAG: hypothetical protein ACQERG_05780, partial [Pseudomonadota bacterium]
MVGIAGIVLVQRHLAPPRAEELGRMAAALGGTGETLVAGGAGTAVAGSPVHRLERGGWLVAAGSGSTRLPVEEWLPGDAPGPALARLTGPFALAAWDAGRGRLVLAADCLGQAPLYFAQARGRVCFATRVAALSEGLGGELEMDPVGLDQLFTLGAPVAPRTVFQGIERVPPGHWLVFEAGHRAVHRFAPPAFEPGGLFAAGGMGGERPLEVALEQVVRDSSATSVMVDPDEGADHPAAALLLDIAGRRGLARQDGGDPAQAGLIAADLETAVQALESPLNTLAPAGEAAFLRRRGSIPSGPVVTTAGGGLVSGRCVLVRELAIRRGWSREPDSRRRPCLLDALDPERLEGASPVWRRALYGMGRSAPDAVTFSHLPRWEERRRIRALYTATVREAIPGDPVAELEEALSPELVQWPG